ncbi:hypothetical protein GXB81_00880 [Paraburkholderia sp. Ac-20336]|uniref:S10 family serine carboxypeptidase-like protein n=1 Tax=Paraburkholderia sp. Ac-20336 TaxID=2703886 RepID=UPI00197FE519|nr:hypothetical protein [Paraburkholderia sp. Ac-20336]MBN3801616.1 hypothetical protein [Paraburkholderia sp. Ac-20336]
MNRRYRNRAKQAPQLPEFNFRKLAVLGSLSLTIFLSACGGDAPSSEQPTAQNPTPPTTSGNTPPPIALTADVPFNDKTTYSIMSNGNVASTDANEGAAVTHRQITINGKTLTYTATTGHLIAYSSGTSQPEATIFYVAYTLDGQQPSTRPVTFFFNGGPGSPASYLLMGSFGPKHVETTQAGTSAVPTTPAPYQLMDNMDTLLDRSDLVFVDPVGTGYSSAVAPHLNSDFWSVDTDVNVNSDFISRYLAVNGRADSPTFLFGESYGGPRTSMMSYALQARLGIQLSGLILQSPALAYYGPSQQPGMSTNVPDFAFATDAMTAWYYKKQSADMLAKSVTEVGKEVEAFINGPYLGIKTQANWSVIRPTYLELTGLDPTVYTDDAAGWQQAVNTIGSNSATSCKYINGAWHFCDYASKLEVALFPTITLGIYDTRQSLDAEVKTIVDSYLSYDPSFVNLDPAYKSTHDAYVRSDLKYNTPSIYAYLGTPVDAAGNPINNVWNLTHVSPDNVSHPTPDATLDLKAEMFINPAMQVFATQGYYDHSTYFAKLDYDLASMKLPASLQGNVTVLNTEAGHMAYADDKARALIRQNVDAFYDKVMSPPMVQMRMSQRSVFKAMH